MLTLHSVLVDRVIPIKQCTDVCEKDIGRSFCVDSRNALWINCTFVIHFFTLHSGVWLVYLLSVLYSVT